MRAVLNIYVAETNKLESRIECLDRTLYHNHSLLKGNNIDN